MTQALRYFPASTQSKFCHIAGGLKKNIVVWKKEEKKKRRTAQIWNPAYVV